jgi:hypothetical protein
MKRKKNRVAENNIIAVAIIHGFVIQALECRIKFFNHLFIIAHKIFWFWEEEIV